MPHLSGRCTKAAPAAAGECVTAPPCWWNGSIINLVLLSYGRDWPAPLRCAPQSHNYRREIQPESEGGAWLRSLTLPAAWTGPVPATVDRQRRRHTGEEVDTPCRRFIHGTVAGPPVQAAPLRSYFGASGIRGSGSRGMRYRSEPGLYSCTPGRQDRAGHAGWNRQARSPRTIPVGLKPALRLSAGGIPCHPGFPPAAIPASWHLRAGHTPEAHPLALPPGGPPGWR